MTEQDRRVLEGILVLLVSMAGLAEQALRMPFPACVPALKVLHLGESIAWRIVLQAVRGTPHLAAPLLINRADADTLVQRLLVLASVLMGLLEQSTRASHGDRLIVGAGQPNPAKRHYPQPETRSLAWLALQHRSAATDQ